VQRGHLSIPEVEYGYALAGNRTLFGVRLHLAVSDQGAMVRFALTPAQKERAPRICSENMVGSLCWDTTATQEPIFEQSVFSKTAAGSGKVPARVSRDLIEVVIGILADQFTRDTTHLRSL